MTTHPERRVFRTMASLLSISALVTGSLALILLTPAPATAATTCQATNLTTLVTSQDLQGTLDAAAPGARIQITGMCVGNFVMDKGLSLIGRRTASGKATLDGDGINPVLTITSQGHYVVVNLQITHGYAGPDSTSPSGGGIYSSAPSRAGTLRLSGHTRVYGNTAVSGAGGIHFLGNVLLNDHAQVDHNTATTGGGIEGSSVAMTDLARVNSNRASHYGGGGILASSVTLSGAAMVDGNRAADTYGDGGGIYASYVYLNDTSQVIGNTASRGGGGIYVYRQGFGKESVLQLEGAASVTGNTSQGWLGGGGIYIYDPDHILVQACANWTGAISPNSPEDPPVVTPAAC